jgi:hypothetical protein
MDYLLFAQLVEFLKLPTNAYYAFQFVPWYGKCEIQPIYNDT